jgi:hypothetical protein
MARLYLLFKTVTALRNPAVACMLPDTDSCAVPIVTATIGSMRITVSAESKSHFFHVFELNSGSIMQRNAVHEEKQ